MFFFLTQSKCICMKITSIGVSPLSIFLTFGAVPMNIMVKRRIWQLLSLNQLMLGNASLAGMNLLARFIFCMFFLFASSFISMRILKVVYYFFLCLYLSILTHFVTGYLQDHTRGAY